MNCCLRGGARRETLAASPDAGSHPACSVQPPCWSISGRRRPASQHRRTQLSRGVKWQAVAFGVGRRLLVHITTWPHAQTSCRTRRGGHSVMEATDSSSSYGSDTDAKCSSTNNRVKGKNSTCGWLG